MTQITANLGERNREALTDRSKLMARPYTGGVEVLEEGEVLDLTVAQAECLCERGLLYRDGAFYRIVDERLGNPVGKTQVLAAFDSLIGALPIALY